jgi:hypothetical protein
VAAIRHRLPGLRHVLLVGDTDQPATIDLRTATGAATSPP